MDSHPIDLDLDRDLFELATAEDCAAFFSRHPEQLSRSTVDKLCARSLEQLRIDLGRAEAAASSAHWVAAELDDSYCLGKSSRALANVRVLQRDSHGALEFSKAAVDHFATAGDEKQEAITRSSAIQSLINLGHYERAVEWIERARSIFRAQGDDLHLARLELNTGALWARRDQPADALESFRAALEILRRVGSAEDIGVCLRNIAVSLQDLHKLAAAEEAYVEAREYLASHDLPLLALEVDYNVAYLYYLRGEYVRAIKHFESGRRRSEELGDRHHQSLSDLDLSEVFLELNLIQEAASLAGRAAEGFSELGMEYERAKALTNGAIAASRLGKAQDAMELLGQARGLFEAEDNPFWIAMLDLYRAIVLLSEGRFYEAAQYAGDALERFGAYDIPSKTAMCEIVLARLDLEDAKPQAAQARCEAALERLESLDLPALEHQALVVSGRAQEMLGENRSAYETYQEAQLRLQRSNVHWQADEFRMAFLEDKLLVHESLVALALGDEPGLEEKEAAFEYMESSKSRSLTDLMSFRAHAVPPRSGQPEMVAHLRRLREELKGYYAKIKIDEREGDRTTVRATGLRYLAERQEDQLAGTLDAVRLVDREFGSLQSAATVELSEIRAALPDGTVILEYFFARGVIYGCVVRREGFEIAPLAAVNHVRELHRSLQFQLSKYFLSPGYLEQFEEFVEHATNTYLRALYQELVAPLEGWLECEHLTVVPHEFLHHLPFHALHDGAGHLIDRCSVSYSPSASVYHLSTTKAAAGGEGALVMSVGGEMAPWILDEANAVAEVLPACDLLVGAEAEFSALRDRGKRARVIHVATRGSYRADNPMFSAIQLGDREISLFDIFELELDADVMVLSGCGNGLGSGLTADGHVGLTRGLLYAGARSLVTTLWDANDESRMIFMRDFYRHLADGRQPAEALRRAMRDLRDVYDHPFFWAPFVLSGRPVLS